MHYDMFILQGAKVLKSIALHKWVNSPIVLLCQFNKIKLMVNIIKTFNPGYWIAFKCHLVPETTAGQYELISLNERCHKKAVQYLNIKMFNRNQHIVLVCESLYIWSYNKQTTAYGNTVCPCNWIFTFQQQFAHICLVLLWYSLILLMCAWH